MVVIGDLFNFVNNVPDFLLPRFLDEDDGETNLNVGAHRLTQKPQFTIETPLLDRKSTYP
jgi:hypothetical protein